MFCFCLFCFCSQTFDLTEQSLAVSWARQISKSGLSEGNGAICVCLCVCFLEENWCVYMCVWVWRERERERERRNRRKRERGVDINEVFFSHIIVCNEVMPEFL